MELFNFTSLFYVEYASVFVVSVCVSELSYGIEVNLPLVYSSLLYPC